jgi:hypothetical protein
MIVELLLNPMTLWLFGTAVLFTALGWYFGKRTQVIDIVAATVDSLINDGYLKTRGEDQQMVILKWQDWENKDE